MNRKREREPQNVYDDPGFFAGYSQLERFGREWGFALEHEAFNELLPDPTGMRVLDLGCGAGQLALHLAQAGAAEVIGLDISARMLELARTQRSHPRITYLQQSIEAADFPPDRFDLVVSSLAFHYVEDYANLVRRIASWLPASGLLVFSCEHPVFTARASNDGWVRDHTGKPQAWMIERYADEGLREEDWLRPGVRKFHRTISTMLNTVLDAGLAIDQIVEPRPDKEALREHPNWMEDLLRPTFLLVRASRS